MVEYQIEHEQRLDRIFHALADTTRRQILSQLQDNPSRVTLLAERYNMSLNAVSKHIKVLEGAGLIKRSVQGRVHLCSLEAAWVEDVENWVHTYRKFWSERLVALEKFMNDKNVTQTKDRKKK